MLQAGTLDADKAKEYGKKLREEQKKLREFIASANADEGKRILVRDYGKEKNYGIDDLTNERNQRILKEKVANGEITLILNPEKQNPHILGTDDYNATNNKSYFDISFDELQEIVNNNYATGKIYIKSRGQIKEVVTLNKDVGIDIDENGIVLGKTNRLTIHYSKKRTHAVPSERKDIDESLQI